MQPVCDEYDLCEYNIVIGMTFEPITYSQGYIYVPIENRNIHVVYMYVYFILTPNTCFKKVHIELYFEGEKKLGRES